MQESNMQKIIKKRRSVRCYTTEQIPEEDLYEILSLGPYAPSGKNRQPWKFVIVKDSSVIKAMTNLVSYSRFISDATVIILLFVKQDSSYLLEKDMLGVGACLQNILLAATDKDYGSCVIGELYGYQVKVSDYIKMDCSEYLLVCGIVLGKNKFSCERKNEIDLNDFILKKI